MISGKKKKNDAIHPMNGGATTERKTDSPAGTVVEPPVSHSAGRNICIALFIATVCVYLPILGNGFVQWDDDISIYANPHVQGLDAHRLWWMFTNVSYSLRYKPLTWLVYALIHSIAGLEPFPYHAIQLLFHGCNAALLYLVARKILGKCFPPQNKEQGNRIELFSALGTLIWALNPLRVEAVARVTDLTYCQSLFFALISLWCYLRAVETNTSAKEKRRWYWRSVICFALAMFTYPFIPGYALGLVILDFFVLKRFEQRNDWWRGETARKIWMEKIPFAALALAIAGVTYYGTNHITGVWQEARTDLPMSLSSRLMQALYVLAYYTWKPWAPFNLSPYYNTLVVFNPRTWPFMASALGVVLLTAFLFRDRRRWPLLFALWICHIVLLAPALGLTVHPHYASDRYSYVEGILWAMLIAGACVKYCDRPQLVASAAAAVAIIALTFGAMSWRQTHIWHDTVTLYRYVMAKLGDDGMVPVLQTRLGKYYMSTGDNDDAITEFETSLTRRPNSPESLVYLGRALFMKGRDDEATARFQEAIKCAPHFAMAHDGYGVTLSHKGRYAEALAEFQQAVKLDPLDADIRNHLNATLEKAKQ